MSDERSVRYATNGDARAPIHYTFDTVESLSRPELAGFSIKHAASDAWDERGRRLLTLTGLRGGGSSSGRVDGGTTT